MKRPAMTILAILLVPFFSTAVTAQESPPEPVSPPVEPTSPPPPPCESQAGFNDFNFWVGEWNVYSNDGQHTLQGTNSITRQHQNCLIMENWTSRQGGTGSSMNYYDPVEDQWRQLWVAGGYSIDYTGGLDASGAMVLSGRINYYASGLSQPLRGSWSAREDGSVRQFIEQQDPETQVWTVWFDGLYVKK